MINGLRSEFYKLFRSRIFWVLLAMSGCFSLIITGLLFLEEKGLLIDQITVEVEGETTDLLGFNVLIESLKYPDGFFTYLFAAVLSSFFISSEFTNGTIKNSVAIGQERSTIYLTKSITVWCGTILVYVAMVGVFTVFSAIFFGIGSVPSLAEWMEALQAFGLTCLFLGAFCAITVCFATIVRSSSVALFTTVGFYLVFATGLDMLAQQYTFFEKIKNYSVFDYITLMSFDSSYDGAFINDLIRVVFLTILLFFSCGIILFKRKDIQ